MGFVHSSVGKVVKNPLKPDTIINSAEGNLSRSENSASHWQCFLFTGPNTERAWEEKLIRTLLPEPCVLYYLHGKFYYIYCTLNYVP